MAPAPTPILRPETARILALFALIVAMFLDASLFQWVSRPEIQLVLAIVIVATLLIYDVSVGMILGVILIVLYFRYHLDAYGVSIFDRRDLYSGGGSSHTLVSKYITPEHLQSAQSNVVAAAAPEDYKGIKGVYGEAVYGAQGLDAAMPGYENPWSPTLEA